MSYHIIGDQDTVLGYRFAGVTGDVVETEAEARAAALELLRRGAIVLFACGIGSPCFSTDTTVVLRGIELECDAILMAKNIDGVYTADPRIDPDATMIRDISYAEASARGLKVMDAAAFTILSDNNVPQVRVFGLEPAGNILKVLQGDSMGTVLHP